MWNEHFIREWLGFIETLIIYKPLFKCSLKKVIISYCVIAHINFWHFFNHLKLIWRTKSDYLLSKVCRIRFYLIFTDPTVLFELLRITLEWPHFEQSFKIWKRPPLQIFNTFGHIKSYFFGISVQSSIVRIHRKKWLCRPRRVAGSFNHINPQGYIELWISSLLINMMEMRETIVILCDTTYLSSN